MADINKMRKNRKFEEICRKQELNVTCIGVRYKLRILSISAKIMTSKNDKIGLTKCDSGGGGGRGTQRNCNQLLQFCQQYTSDILANFEQNVLIFKECVRCSVSGKLLGVGYHGNKTFP